MNAYASSIKQHRVSRQQPCPVCRKTHGCLLYESHVVCLRVPSDLPAQGGLGGWRHSLHEPELYRAVLSNFAQPSSERLAPAATLDKVYRALHSNLTLTPLHKKHLVQERQLTQESIQARGYQSWGQGDRMLRSRLAETLYDLFGGVVLDVPGFLLREQSRTYLTLGGPAGILIPVRNTENQIVAHQIRTDRPGDSGKYVWLSSTSRGGPGPGSPVHVSRPLTPFVKDSKRMWLTEGPLKADIASERLGEVVLALPGVQADKHLLKTLQRLQERGELSELVIALDSDWHDKPAVASARFKLAETAARQGIPVWLADWTTSLKGLDDLLVAGGQPKLAAYQVSGNGKRPFEEISAPAAAAAPAMSLEDARAQMEATLLQALEGELGDPKELGILLSPLPGTGKSTVLSQVLNRYHRNRSPRRYSAYFVPRHDLADNSDRKSWAFLSGRTHADPETGQTPCAYPERQKEIARLRIPGQVGCEHCPQQAACKEAQQPNNLELPYYWGQFRQPGKVRVYPAQHFLTPSLWGNPAAVVLDDCDLKSLMLETFALSQSYLGYALHWAEQHLSHAYAKAQPLLHVLYEILRTAPAGQAFHWDGVALMSLLEKAAQEHQASMEQLLSDASQAKEPDPFEENTLLDGPKAVPVRFLEPLLGILQHEWNEFKKENPYNRRLRLERSSPGQEAGFRLTLRRELPIAALANSLLILSDASLTLEEARRLYPERRWIEVKPHLKIPAAAKIIQFTDYNYGKIHLATPKERFKALQKIGELVAKHRGQRIGLISHQSFSSAVRHHFPEIQIGHYYGQRGSNEFADCDVLICFGTPNPNPQELERQAEALYWDQEVINSQTLLEPRVFEQPGERVLQTRVRAYRDPRLHEMHRGKREEELLQAIFRARPLSLDPQYRKNLQLGLDFGDENTRGQPRQEVTIYVFSSLPLEGLTVQARSLAQPVLSCANDSNVIPLEEAAKRLWREKQRLTDAKILKESQVQRASLLRWKRSRPTYQVEAAAPPCHGPPQDLEIPQELVANMF